MKDVYDENRKIMMKETEENTEMLMGEKHWYC